MNIKELQDDLLLAAWSDEKIRFDYRWQSQRSPQSYPRQNIHVKLTMRYVYHHLIPAVRCNVFQEMSLH